MINTSYLEKTNTPEALRTNFSKQKVNTAEVNAVSAVKGKKKTAVKSSAGCNWRPKRHYWNQVSKYNGGSSLWYSRDSPFELVAYTDSDYAGATQDRKSTTGGCQFLGNRLISWQCKKQTMVATSTTKAEYVAAASCYRQVGDETIHKELGDRMERAATTASSLKAEQDSSNINRTQSMAILNEPNGEVEITATIDGQRKTITEASLRRHLKLEDADCISSLPNIEIFKQLALIGMLVQGPIQQGEGLTVLVESHHIPITTPSTSQPLLSSPPGLEQDLKQSKKVYSNAYTKLIMRVKKLEHKVKSRQPKRRARVVQDKGTSWIQEDAEIQGRTSADTKILSDQEEPTKLVGDLGSGEKGEKEISTANILVSTASATLEVSTTAENLINEEERQRITRDAEIAKQLQEQEVVAEVYQAHDIDWSDPAVLRYHALQNRSFSVAEVRKNMCMYLKNQGGYKQSHFKGMSYEDIRPIFERSSKKRIREDSDEDNAKKQKLNDDAKKEELRDSMDVVPRDDIANDVESLATKYPIVD
ncbi:hypothetical protein Tco_0008662 [Tanacetum coccineum]